MAGPWLVLDAAHTGGSARALVSTLREAFPAPRHRLAYVVAAASDKDLSGILTALRAAGPAAVAFTTVPIAGSTHRWLLTGTCCVTWRAESLLLCPIQAQAPASGNKDARGL